MSTTTITLLGSVDASVDGRPVELGTPQQRQLVALLACHPGRLASVDSIVDALWPEGPPASVTKIVQTYVSRLRKELGAGAIERRGTGYVLNADVDVDVEHFRRLVREGRFEDAISAWSGEPFAGIPPIPVLDLEAHELRELHMGALEQHIDALLAGGHAVEAVPELRSLVVEHPMRETFAAQLMLALYRAGRQTEALEVYRQARGRLVGEVGIEPGKHLKVLERLILAHDPSLDLEATASSPTAAHQPERRRLRRRVAMAAVLVVAMGAILVVTSGALTDNHPQPVPIEANSVVRIDPNTNIVVQSIPVGRNPTGIDATDDAVWVANERDRTVTRIDLGGEPPRTIGGLQGVGFLTHDERGTIYASGWDYPTVWQIDPDRMEIAQTYRVRTVAVGLAVGGGSLWALDRLANAVARVDLARAKVTEEVPVGADPLKAVFEYGALWVANSDEGTVTVLRDGVSMPSTIRGMPRAFGIAAGEHGIWVASHSLSAVFRIDPDTRRIVANIPVGKSRWIQSGLYDVAAGAGGVWASNHTDREIVRIDPGTNKIVARIPFPEGTTPSGIAIHGDDVWVSVAETADSP